MKDYSMYIDGHWVGRSERLTVDIVNPATEETFARVPQATIEDTEKAIQAARRSFEQGIWRNMDPGERCRIMKDIFTRFKEKSQYFANLETKNTGMPVKVSQAFNVAAVQSRFEWFLKAANRIFEEPKPLYRGLAAAFPYIRREPLGVCSQIVPWNGPLLLGTQKLVAPLLAGNSVVIKPATLTPCSLIDLVRLFDDSEIPKGVVNLLTGPGSTVGELMASHPMVDKVTFTGSTEVGKRVLASAAPSIKKATMELGGKSAAIFLDDTDIDLAVSAAIWGCFLHSGQICYATTRALVHESMYDEFVEKLVDKVNRIKIGDPMDPNTAMGPVTSEQSRANIEKYIAIGREEGANLACGGGRPVGLDKGFFVEPTVFVDVDNKMTIAQEEIFGPVLCVIKYKDDEEAVSIANDSSYGLLGAVYSNNIERAIGIGEKLIVGNVCINELHMMSLELPYGGVKQSGIGKERGLEGFLDEYTEMKSIQIDLGHDLSQRVWHGLIVPQ